MGGCAGRAVRTEDKPVPLLGCRLRTQAAAEAEGETLGSLGPQSRSTRSPVMQGAGIPLPDARVEPFPAAGVPNESLYLGPDLHKCR